MIVLQLPSLYVNRFKTKSGIVERAANFEPIVSPKLFSIIQSQYFSSSQKHKWNSDFKIGIMFLKKCKGKDASKSISWYKIEYIISVIFSPILIIPSAIATFFSKEHSYSSYPFFLITFIVWFIGMALGSMIPEYNNLRQNK